MSLSLSRTANFPCAAPSRQWRVQLSSWIGKVRTALANNLFHAAQHGGAEADVTLLSMCRRARGGCQPEERMPRAGTSNEVGRERHACNSVWAKESVPPLSTAQDFNKGLNLIWRCEAIYMRAHVQACRRADMLEVRHRRDSHMQVVTRHAGCRYPSRINGPVRVDRSSIANPCSSF
ncbi:hypothetical protein L1887_53402 [Cichorium endivia]|nr:hypothetical protein L1887_53402 [Cichorium endivia]